MKLLFDENLSHNLVGKLANVYPDSEHVRNAALKEASDTEIWEYARAHSYVIVSKDSDFHQRSLLLGFPPKVIWVKLGNCSTRSVEKLLRENSAVVAEFEADSTASFLILS